MKVDILSLYLSLFWFSFYLFLVCVWVCWSIWRGGGLCKGEGGLRSGGVEEWRRGGWRAGMSVVHLWQGGQCRSSHKALSGLVWNLLCIRDMAIVRFDW